MVNAITHWLSRFKLHPAPLIDTPEAAAVVRASSYQPESIPMQQTSGNQLQDRLHVLSAGSHEKTSFLGEDSDGLAGRSSKSDGLMAGHTSLTAPGDLDDYADGTSSIHDFAPKPEGLHRKLNQFHIQMIAFGGSIGTGLYIGSGSVYASGGPGFLIIDYCIIGSMLLGVIFSLGELAVIFPVSGSFATYASRFISPAWGFANGWNYWMQWYVTFPLELVASVIIIGFWNEHDGVYTVNPGVWVIICWIVIAIINIFGVAGYGNFEVVGSVVKILMTLGFIVAGIVISAGGGPNHEAVGLRYWRHGDAFLNGFKGFCSVFVSAAFAFSGTEMIGLTSAETKNPRKSVPKATRQIFMRIMLFYIGSLFIVTLNLSPHEPRLTEGDSHDPNSSPFTLVLSLAGVKVLPHIVNAVILVGCLSVANTSVYGSSRTLLALAQNGQAPRAFAYVDCEGRPMPAVALQLAFGFLAFLVYSTSEGDVFDWLLALSGLAVIFSWGTACLVLIRFRAAWKAAGRTVEEIPWRSPVGVVGAWYGFSVCVIVLILQAVIAIAPIGAEDMSAEDRAVTFFQAYLAVPVVIVFLIFGEMDWEAVFLSPWHLKYVGSVPVWYGPQRWWLGSWVKLEDIDIDTGRREAPSLEQLRAEREEYHQWPIWRKVLDFFF